MATNSTQLLALRKKRVNQRRAHRAVATKLISEGHAATTESNGIRLRQLKRSLSDKLTLLEKLDEEVIDLIEDEEELLTEVERADEVKNKIRLAEVMIDDYCTHQGDDALSTSSAGNTPSGNMVSQDSKKTVRFS